MKTPFLILSCLTLAFSAILKDRFDICALIDCNATKKPSTTQSPSLTTKSPSPTNPSMSGSEPKGNFGHLKAQLVSSIFDEVI